MNKNGETICRLRANVTRSPLQIQAERLCGAYCLLHRPWWGFQVPAGRHRPPCLLVSTSEIRGTSKGNPLSLDIWLPFAMISRQRLVFRQIFWSSKLHYSFNSWASIASALSGPSLFTLGIMCSGDMNLTNSCSSVKLLCSLYGTSYLWRQRNGRWNYVTCCLDKYCLNKGIHNLRRTWILKC